MESRSAQARLLSVCVSIQRDIELTKRLIAESREAMRRIDAAREQS